MFLPEVGSWSQRYGRLRLLDIAETLEPGNSEPQLKFCSTLALPWEPHKRQAARCPEPVSTLLPARAVPVPAFRYRIYGTN